MVASQLSARCVRTNRLPVVASCKSRSAARPVPRGRRSSSAWTQTPLKRAVDIVVVMSERKSVNSVKAQFANLLREINRRMTRKGRYDVRFSLIGFGGSGVAEKAHLRPVNGEIFTQNIKELSKEIVRT